MSERERVQQELDEVWLPVVGASAYYEVSNLGRVRSLRFRNGNADRLRDEPKIVDGYHNRGYRRVHVCGRLRVVHYLVLEAFVGPKPPGAHAAHLDCDPGNNRLSNLIWASPAENMSHKLVHYTSQAGEQNPCHKLTDKEVAEIRNLYTPENRKALADRYGVSTDTIGSIVHGKMRAKPTPVNPLKAECDRLAQENAQLRSALEDIRSIVHLDQSDDECVTAVEGYLDGLTLAASPPREHTT